MADNNAHLPALENMTVAELEDYVRFVSGSSPVLLANEITGKLNNLPQDACSSFLAAILIAATTQKRVLVDWLSQQDQAVIARFIRTEYYIQDHVNFTALNMMGHCCLASGYDMSLPAVDAFRERLGGNSIWDMNFKQTTISEEMARIFEERTQRFAKPAAVEAGNTIMAAIYTRAGMAQFMSHFAEPDDPGYKPPIIKEETPLERKARIQKIKLERGAAKAAEELEKYDPHKDSNATWDPFCCKT